MPSKSPHFAFEMKGNYLSFCSTETVIGLDAGLRGKGYMFAYLNCYLQVGVSADI